jgi:MraZ protein
VTAPKVPEATKPTEPKADLQPVILNAPAPAPTTVIPPEVPPKTDAPAGATWTKPEGTPPPPTAAVAPAPITKPMPPASAEPPLAPDTKGPLQTYHVKHASETMRDIARRTLGTADRWSDVHRLNPALKPEEALAAGTVVKLPPDACLPADDGEVVRPLPVMRPQAPPAKPKELAPLTGTYLGNLDDKQAMTLPKALREQLGNCETVLVSPGPDQCLWLTNQAHLDHLADRLEHSPAREADVRVFKRLYYAQTEKAGVDAEGRVTVPERLAQFAGLHQEVVLVGVDDHFELWDAARWRQYTQQKGGAARTASAD